MSSSAPTEFEVVFTSGPKTGSEGTLAIGQDAVPSAQGGAAFPSTVTHLEIPSLVTSADGTGTIMQWGGSEKSWVLASGGTFNSVSKIDTAVSTLQSYVVSNETNFGVGPDVLNQLTTGTQNTAVGDLAAGGEYTVTTGSGNVMVGYKSGGSCETGSNNTFLGTNTQFTPGSSDFNGSIGLGSDAIISADNQFMVASNVTSFNMSGLTASTGTGTGTILEFDSAGNILPSAGKFNTVASIDTAVSTLQSYTVSNGSNFGVGPSVFSQLTTGVQNAAIGNLSAVEYSVTTGSGNVMIGYNSGANCQTGNNNTFLGAYAQFESGMTSINSSIGLGYDAIINADNQLMVASAITSFNMSGLAASTGSGEGTILEFDSAGNILPSAGTYNTVASIDKIIAAINAPYAMRWTSTSEFTYDSSDTPQSLAIWDTITFGNSANMSLATIWTCPAAGLWNISAAFGISLTVSSGYVQIQLYHNDSSIFLTTFWINVGESGQGVVKNTGTILVNLAAGDTLDWYMTTYQYTATIGGGSSNGGTTSFNAIRIGPGYTAA